MKPSFADGQQACPRTLICCLARGRQLECIASVQVTAIQSLTPQQPQKCNVSKDHKKIDSLASFRSLLRFYDDMQPCINILRAERQEACARPLDAA